MNLLVILLDKAVKYLKLSKYKIVPLGIKVARDFLKVRNVQTIMTFLLYTKNFHYLTLWIQNFILFYLLIAILWEW